MATGRFGGANFSPNCGENGSNSEAKSSVMMPVKCAATCVEVKTQNFASADVWSSQGHFLAVAQVTRAPGERRDFAATAGTG